MDPYSASNTKTSPSKDMADKSPESNKSPDAKTTANSTAEQQLQRDKRNLPENVDPSLQTNKNQVDFAPEKADVNSFKFYPDDPESTLNRFRFSAKGASEYYDPCQESSKMSFKCLELNNYDRDLCRDYFDAYRECKKQWLKARRQNREFWE